jgi:DNA topoisomerase-1
MDEAVALFAQPKTRGNRTAKGPLRELGADQESGATMVVKDGRFGPYVTDGTTNASLRRGDDVESLTVERASELLAERRATGPSARKKSAANKAPAKKRASSFASKKATGTKKAGAKKAAGPKAAAKKAAAKKAAVKRTSSPE